MSEFTQFFLLWTLVFTTVLYSEAEEKQNMFQRGKTIMRIKSMMKGMLAVVMAMSMAACSGAPAADQTSSESPSPAQTESTATEQETIVTEVSAETQTQEETAKAPKYVFCLLVMV